MAVAIWDRCCNLTGRATNANSRALAAAFGKSRVLEIDLKASPGGAKVGHASLMRPERPLPTRRSSDVPLRRNPNIATAIIAA